MGSFRGPVRRASRPLPSFLCRILIVTIILCFLQQQRLFYSYQAALSAKYSPTYFGDESDQFSSEPGVSAEKGTSLQDELLANRDSWNVLGEGWEGTIYSYKDVVIKTFKIGQSPLRNCMARSTSRWPTEIPATAYFGARALSKPTNGSSDDTLITRGGFLPVHAYFQASASPTSPTEWHLVTPLIPGGNLKGLAKQLRKSETPNSFRDLDAQYRPTFHRLLETLDTMHRDGYCHDDVKPGNIFIETSHHWALGDLGNVRHISHPYHTTRIWTENKQYTDCRANDAVRLLKTYLYFLRRASSDPERFDAEFFAREEPLSKLFWHVMSKSETMSARQVRLLSFSEAPLQEDQESVHAVARHGPSCFQALFDRVPFSSPRTVWRRRSINEALRTSMSEGRARFWAMAWLFKIPETPC
ncbi:hypothetical protein DM02DRAFT_640601 [Periconia macrospinosa]|uniref:Protein kinase domain-containing protein n=1 Tax=Periconia macrospinosa TaxID=97972 RepID=A0A2V1E1X9_9PLEO|nr:hypothetical protein DM02DRAFT_640601 [Periconia macrospinosa]